MKILGLRIGRSHSGRKRRKRAPTKLEKIYNKKLLDAVLESPKVMAAVIDKYGELPAFHEDELEPIINDIRSKIQEKAVQTALKNRRQELVTRIDEIINDVMGASHSSRRQYKKPVVDIGTSGQDSTPDTLHQRRTTGRHPSQVPNVRAFMEGLEIIAFLSKLASEQAKDGLGNAGERVYVVEQNGHTVEMSEKEYLGYALEQYLRQKKKIKTPPLDVPRLPRVTSTDRITEKPPQKNEKESSSIEP